MTKNIVFGVDKTEAGSGKHTVTYTTTGNLNKGRNRYFKTVSNAKNFAIKKGQEIANKTKRQTRVTLDIGRYTGTKILKPIKKTNKLRKKKRRC